MMLAFIATYGDEYCDLFHAETKSKAKYRAWKLSPGGPLDWDQIYDITMKRLPGCDDKPFNYENAKAAGFEYFTGEYDKNGDMVYCQPEEFYCDCDCPVCRLPLK